MSAAGDRELDRAFAELTGWTEVTEQAGPTGVLDSAGVPPTMNKHEQRLRAGGARCIVPGWSSHYGHTFDVKGPWALLRAQGWSWRHREYEEHVEWLVFRRDNPQTHHVGKAPLGEDALAITAAAVGALRLMAEVTG